MNQVGVKLLLQGGQWLMVSMTEAEWKSLQAAYCGAKQAGGTCALRGVSFLLGERIEWLAWTDQVVALHTFDPNAVQQAVAAPQQTGPWVGGRGSGLN